MRRVFAFLLTIILLACLCSCELSYQAPAVGKMRILVYGNDYSYGIGHGNKVYDKDGNLMKGYSAPKLEKTVNDATQVGRALAKLAEKAHIDDHEEIYLTDPADVTKDRLVLELETLADSSSENDITIIFFSGHGFGVSKKQAYGTDTAVLSYMATRYPSIPDSSILFPVSDFLTLVNAIKGVKVVLGDFCYSGSLVQSNNFSVTSGEYSLLDPATLFFRYRDDICGSSSLFCLSASRYYELSYENAPNHGNFTNALLEALGWDEENQCLKTAEAEKNGRITLFEIANYVTAHDGESRQTPMVSGGSNDFILFSF